MALRPRDSPSFDDFPVRLARAGSRTAAGLLFRFWRWQIGRLFGRRVGGHLYGRFCRRGRIPAPTARRPHRNPRRLQVAAGRFPPDPRRSFNPPQRPAQPPQGNHLLFLFFAQDIAHVDGGYSPSGSMSWLSYLVGRFSGDHLWPVLGGHRGREPRPPQRISVFFPLVQPKCLQKPRFRKTCLKNQFYRELKLAGILGA